MHILEIYDLLIDSPVIVDTAYLFHILSTSIPQFCTVP